MKIRVSGAVACAALLAGCASQPQNVTIRAGQTSTIGFAATMTKACDDQSPPKPELAVPPKSGTVTFGITKAPFNNKNSNCNGVPMTGAYVTFTPQKGFHGEERFTVRWNYISNDGGGTANMATEYIVKVK